MDTKLVAFWLAFILGLALLVLLLRLLPWHGDAESEDHANHYMIGFREEPPRRRSLLRRLLGLE